MGVYSKAELSNLTPGAWVKMIDIHKNDLRKYYQMPAYDARERDIDETIQNIHVLMSMIVELDQKNIQEKEICF